MRCRGCDFSPGASNSMYHNSLTLNKSIGENKLIYDPRDQTWICLDCLDNSCYNEGLDDNENEYQYSPETEKVITPDDEIS